MSTPELTRVTSPIGMSRALYIAVHLGAIAAPFVELSGRVLAIFAVSYVVRVFAVGAGYHRYFAHRAFRASRPVQFAFGLVGITALQRGPLWWAETHRDHHRNADTPDDIHSPRYQGFGYAQWGWFFAERHRRTNLAGVRDLARFPELVWLDSTPVCALAAFLLGAGLWLGFGFAGFLWGFCVSTVLLWHIVHSIQSVSHSMGGYRNFVTSDASRNHWLIALISLGEWHNNHHHRAASARQGYRFWELDVTWMILRGMAAVGLVSDVRDRLREHAPAPELEDAQEHG